MWGTSGSSLASDVALTTTTSDSRLRCSGGISKQGNRLLRFVLVEAANIAVRFDPVFRKEYLHRCHQKHFTVAKVAAARKLAIRMYWILRTQTPYPQVLSSRVA